METRWEWAEVEVLLLVALHLRETVPAMVVTTRPCPLELLQAEQVGCWKGVLLGRLASHCLPGQPPPRSDDRLTRQECIV